MTEQILSAETDLTTRFPEWVETDERDGYEGYIVQGNNLIEFAISIRDELGYDFLSSVTGVDYYPENMMEVVYHVYKSLGGSALVFKVQVSRENPVVHSLVSVYPGADFQEREAWDLLGIKFQGHPNHKRILMWDGFAGHPLRKDWKEAYFEADAKPYKNRWPEGSAVYRAEEENAFYKNVSYPKEFNPDTWIFDGDEAIYQGLKELEKESDLDTELVIVNLGPQHPSTHGVFRMVVSLNGETVVKLEPVMGYLHRNHAKIGERNTYLMNMPFTDRLDYICSMSNNFGYALAVEKLLGAKAKPPERAEYIRVIMAEFTRISNHLIAIGTLLNDLGAYFTPMMYVLEERELIIDLFEATSGSRMMCNYFRFGGVARDLPPGVYEKMLELVNERLPRKIDELDRYLTENEVVRTRCEGVGVLSPDEAIAYSAVGPVLRASGVPYDVRRADPYSIYDRFEFDVIARYHGDVYDRYLVRLDEIRQSIRIIKQALRDIPEGPIIAGRPQYQVRVPKGEAYGRVEGPKGELGFYLVSDGKPNPLRYHVRAPSFINLTTLSKMCEGNKVADAIVILGSIDIVLGETDR